MRIAILGFGRMGNWFTQMLSEENEMAVVEPIKEKKVVMRNVRFLDDLSELENFGPDLLLNCVPIDKTIPAFEDIIPVLKKECIICDITSVKSELPSFYKKMKMRFVSIHPMFGPTFSKMGDLKGENAVLIEGSDERGAQVFTMLFESSGIRIFRMSFEEHDKAMAYSLTLPFAATMVFSSCVHEIPVPGTTFKRHLETARALLSEDNHLLAEILFNPNSIKQIERITARLEFLKHIIRGRDYGEAARFFQNLRNNIGEGMGK